VVPPFAVLGSFDVVELFTTTPVPETLELLERRLRADSSLKERTHHTVETILKLVKLCVENTYFQFGNKFYQQTCGMAMGSPLSPVICNMYMEDLEEKAMSTFHVKPHIMLRYVDDKFYEWPEDLCPVKDFFDHLNQQSPHIQFTMETEQEGIAPFLDVKVIKSNGKFTTEVYRKKTDSGLYLQYDSNHPKPVKNGIVNTLLHRAETHSTLNVANVREVELVKKTLVRNKYPKRLVENIENKRKNKKDEGEKIKPDGTLIIPYIARLGETISRIAKKINIRMVFTSKSTLRNKLVHFKPKSDTPTKGMIYKIPCECGKVYIGETGRTLDTRLQEHKRSVQKRDPDISKLAEHAITMGHRFLWTDAEIIGRETNWKAREFQEAAEIYKAGENAISSPSFDIHPVWLPVIKNLKFGIHKKQQVRRSARIRDKALTLQSQMTDR
jgi:hypothetical protein